MFHDAIRQAVDHVQRITDQASRSFREWARTHRLAKAPGGREARSSAEIGQDLERVAMAKFALPAFGCPGATPSPGPATTPAMNCGR